MRTLNKNKQKLWYSLQDGEQPKYKTDYEGNILYEGYTDDEGNFIYYLDEETGDKKPIETGEPEPKYLPAVEFKASISMGGSETQAEVFGLDITGYDCVVVLNKGQIPVDETSLIWFEHEPEYFDEEHERIKWKQADYQIVKKIDSLNSTTIVLKKRLK